MPDFHCLRCGTPMRFAGRDKLQLGKTSWLFGDLPNLMAGALEVSIMACPACGKLDFSPAAQCAATAMTLTCTNGRAPPVAFATTSTTPNAPSVVTPTPGRTNCKYIVSI